MPSIRMLMLNSPSFKLVRSMLRTISVLQEEEKKSFELLSMSSADLATNRRRHKTLEFFSTEGGNADAGL